MPRALARKILWLSTALMLLPFTAYAEVMDKRFYVAPAFAYSLLDSDYNLEDDVGFHLSIGKPISRYFNLELQGTYLKTAVDNGPGEGEITGFGADVLFFPNREKLPFFGILGIMDAEVEVESGGVTVTDEGELIDVGIGVHIPFTAYGLAYRTEYRHRFAKFSDDFNDDVLMASLQIPLGAAPVPPPPPPPAPPPPPPKPVAKPVPPPAPVLPKPTIVLQGVHFEFDSADLTQQAQTILSNMAVTLREMPDLRAIAIGHTCSIGEEDYNDRLSLARATSVRTFLVNRGVDGARIRVRGYGETRPVADNSTKSGRELNRRVEISVVGDNLCLPAKKGESVDANGCAILD